ncbi:U3 small nucleolar RNA-associated protein 14 homolog A [Neocloeon triangulifer]|uniref:U3 small nucleolar RNA-associated protein 14 homolog A n=1 Tax=Neocloeon triangulifer TaxID=2078957 RepID=UPI00286F9C4C|nr:U3 small nucleolar RNA-associated protein 14 homolog A [Neocloeon triangulifer]
MDEEIMSDDSDVENPKSHSKLLSAISKLDYTERIKPAKRKEPSHQVSEFHLAKVRRSKGKSGVDVSELADALKTSSTVKIRRKFQELQKKPATLPKPLEKIFADKVQRKEGYEKVKAVLSRWDDVVESNRVADKLEFPAKNQDVKVFETNIMSSVTAPKTDLEKKVYSMLEQSGYIAPQAQEPEVDEYPLTLEEVLAKRREFGDLKRKSIQQQMKTWRQNKIKSKKFHRILRREKMRQQIKEFEALKEKNPEEALKRLDAIERSRAEERALLRHKNTGSWAKNQQVRAKYNKEVRQVLSKQIELSRELTQKIKKPGDESSDEDDSDAGSALPHPDLMWSEGSNKDGKKDEISNFVSGYRKFWEEQNKSKGEKALEAEEGEELEPPQIMEPTLPDVGTEVEEDERLELMEDLLEIRKDQEKFENNQTGKNETKRSNKGLKVKERKKSKSGSWMVIEDRNNTNVIDLFDKLEEEQGRLVEKSLQKMKKAAEEIITVDDGEEEENSRKGKKGKKKKAAREEFHPWSVESLRQTERPKSAIEISNTEGTSREGSANEKRNLLKNSLDRPVETEDENIDPTKFLNPKPLKSRQGEMIVIGGENLDEDRFSEKQKAMLAELFADDDVVDEFQKEKEELEAASKPKEIDMTLPGWGEWGGSNTQVSTRKRKRFILKPKVEAPRRDRNLRNVIINEEKDSGISQHQVNELPHPFTSVKEFEASLRAPVGRNWVPETAHRQMIASRVITHAGQKIEPMKEDVLMKEKKKPLIKTVKKFKKGKKFV